MSTLYTATLLPLVGRSSLRLRLSQERSVSRSATTDSEARHQTPTRERETDDHEAGYLESDVSSMQACGIADAERGGWRC